MTLNCAFILTGAVTIPTGMPRRNTQHRASKTKCHWSESILLEHSLLCLQVWELPSCPSPDSLAVSGVIEITDLNFMVSDGFKPPAN